MFTRKIANHMHCHMPRHKSWIYISVAMSSSLKIPLTLYFPLIHNFASSNELALKLCISGKHSDWSVRGDTIHFGDAFGCSIQSTVLQSIYELSNRETRSMFRNFYFSKINVN